jgi:hypothetical protein
MKLLKRLLFCLVLLVFLVALLGLAAFWFFFVPGKNNFLSENHLAKNSIEPATSNENIATVGIDMRWCSTHDDPENQYGALLVPIHFAGIDRVFFMQFDLGHPDTIFYEQKLASILKRADGDVQQDNVRNREGLEFQIGSTKVKMQKIKTRKASGGDIDWDHPDSVELIGTVGSDFVEGHVLMMDFPNAKIFRFENCDQTNVADDQWMPFSFRFRRTLLPAKIDGKETLVMYDSGSSAYDLITSKSTFETLAVPGSAVKTTGGNSWGKRIEIRTRPCEARMEFKKISLPIRSVTQMGGMGSLTETMMGLSGMQGMTGNNIFLNHRLILDYENQRFAIVAQTGASLAY